MSGGFKLGYC